MIDIIILSNGKSDELIDMTQNCINSLHASEDKHWFNAIVFEQQFATSYRGADTIHYKDPFHYNRLMNRGIEMTDEPWVAICNNDLIFHKGWLTECLKHDYLSMSPNQIEAPEGVKEGYQIGNDGELKGWCILINREVFKSIGKIDESVNFHYSDNVYADQLKKAGIKHALIEGAYVEHLDGKTLETLDKDGVNKYCTTQTEIYNNKPVKITGFK